MTNLAAVKVNFGRRSLLWVLGLLIFAALLLRAQDAQWEAASGGTRAFEVASIRQKTSEQQFTPPTFPLSSDDSYRPNGGLFSADFPLPVYIGFAYKLSLTPEQIHSMMAHLPKWVEADRFEIHARAAGNPTKDQMRLMMQALLADRFKLAIHFETQQLPVLALTLVKVGKLGANLRPHAEGAPCDAPAPVHSTEANAAEVFPDVCDVYAAESRANRILMGSRNTTMALLASALPSIGQLGRPVIDRTGLSGRFDFKLQWTPESNNPAPPSAEAQPELQETTFLEALREQLGLKLESQKGPVKVLVIDQVEKPSEN